MATDCILATLPGSSDAERLLVVLLPDDPDATLSLRQQSWAEGIGWYDQRTLDFSPEQVRALRQVLGQAGGRSRRPEPGEAPATLPFPRLVRVESA